MLCVYVYVWGVCVYMYMVYICTIWYMYYNVLYNIYVLYGILYNLYDINIYGIYITIVQYVIYIINAL